MQLNTHKIIRLVGQGSPRAKIDYFPTNLSSVEQVYSIAFFLDQIQINKALKLFIIVNRFYSV